jgi:hypothetical protein
LQYVDIQEGTIMLSSNSSRKEDFTMSSDLASSRDEPHKILVPIKNFEQGRFAVRVLLSMTNDFVSEIRLFHCIKDKLARPTFFSAMEVIRTADEQTDRLDDSKHFLEQLTKDLLEKFDNVSLTTKSSLTDSIHEGILEEAEDMQATKIIFVMEPTRKFQWFRPEVTARVMSDAKIPVHIIKPGQQKDSGHQLLSA